MADRPYTEADVERVAEVIERRFGDRVLDVWPEFRPEARAVLDALAATGRLLPEGWTVARVDEQFRKLAADVNQANRPPTGGYTGLTGQIIVTVDHGSTDE